MESNEIQRVLLQQFGIRIEPEMAAYLLRHLDEKSRRPEIAVMGGEARTGRAIRQIINMGLFDGPAIAQADSP